MEPTPRFRFGRKMGSRLEDPQVFSDWLDLVLPNLPDHLSRRRLNRIIIIKDPFTGDERILGKPKRAPHTTKELVITRSNENRFGFETDYYFPLGDPYTTFVRVIQNVCRSRYFGPEFHLWSLHLDLWRDAPDTAKKVDELLGIGPEDYTSWWNKDLPRG